MVEPCSAGPHAGDDVSNIRFGFVNILLAMMSPTSKFGDVSIFMIKLNMMGMIKVTVRAPYRQ